MHYVSTPRILNIVSEELHKLNKCYANPYLSQKKSMGNVLG